ncbi:dehydrodolichyl diphosphate synthase complex subunit NUS1-like isoform X1 [Triticum urartu]|uniref:dehydrodolichyl diphosphate synthase complex subunit NUS1-like isoform X1 n=1 Tax=Triticum urartu TaxID=4572 RepID=UPI0020445D24|nr:dehydrodolichyl diphosphate synthase complex subunit NUS1-like isoform X1 [Triticum urartu]
MVGQMQISWPSTIVELILGLLWHLVHLLVSLFDLWSHLSDNLECYLISSGLLPKYRDLHFERLNYVGVVVDSREANNVLKIKQLLRWLSTIGVKYVVLYDIEGVLKEWLKPGIKTPRDENSRTNLDLSAHGGMAIECLSGSDGKEGIAKAANLLCSDFCNRNTHGHNKLDNAFTEADMVCALREVGSGGPEPDLLLVYGPVRCHLGFPAWRLRFTEIMHMGSLKSMKYGSIVKALHRFSHKYQNYGNPIFQLGNFDCTAAKLFSFYLHRRLHKIFCT